jgi:hypothetical protein
VLMAGATTAQAGVSMDRTRLVTLAQVKQADPATKWITQVDKGRLPSAYCGPASTEGKLVAQRLARGYTDEMMTYGTQYLSRYNTKAAAKAAYTSILATLRTCKYSKPSPTHARRITENRRIVAGDATTILRWWDYALPSDPGSENGAFPYAVTVKGTTVSVIAVSSDGVGMPAASIDKLAKTAAARLP